ncbi:hypothetical protein PSECIP111854_03991 [Pseudoalteromonas sp. CIP111854]|uniref:ParB/Sulfiredoxin domain-containing protein n=1 Tax=Pseudoalteromonas holothuriae TaxID=2963714 RepID=A0A9W4R5H3_9GAMM|nr:hypothetical protein [Pseudoalteromonas sp. CIP111854]CAH9066941.1 hypothetical protein PSECIP111854_03991 [Pseudoalteromonas sp. CIP111854]
MALKHKGRMKDSLPETKLPDGSIEKLMPSGNKVRFYPFEIKAEDLPEIASQSKFNPRRYEDLKLPAVEDIFPSIKESKRNAYPIYIVGSLDNFKVIVGLRRFFAVKNVPGAVLVGYRVNHLESSDECYLAKWSDKYVAPSFVDIGLTIKKERDFSELSARQLAELFDVSKDTANMGQRVAKLPKRMFELFPAYQYVTFRFVQEVSGLELPEDKLNNVIDITYEKFLSDIEDYSKEVESPQYAKLSKSIQNFILKQIREPIAKPENPWQDFVKVKNIKTKVDAKGRLSITLDEHVEPALIEKVFDLLNEGLR